MDEADGRGAQASRGRPTVEPRGIAAVAGSARSLVASPLIWLWIAVWLVTRAFIVAHVGYWAHGGTLNYEDVHQFQVWAQEIAASHALPVQEAWQYPPGAALLMLIPRLTGGSYGESFVILMLLFDLVGLCLLARLGRREGNYTGVWIWLLLMPALAQLSVLRFDLAPTVIAVAAMTVVHLRPRWFGALAGLGAMVKAWPLVLILGEWDRRRLLRSVLAALAAIALVLIATAIFFDHPLGFLGEQSGRGLQVEAVAAVPWQLREIVTGRAVPEGLRYGAWEVESPTADVVAELLKWCSVLALVAAAGWWAMRDRAIRRGRADLADVVVARDFAFTIVLLLVVTSRVLSPQYMIWVLGMAAVVLTASRCHVKRAAWIALGALALSTSVYHSPQNDVVRDVALLIAAVDASCAMCLLLGRPKSAGSAAARSPS